MVIRLNPSAEQALQLRRWAGASRQVWNWVLSYQNAHYRRTKTHLSVIELSREFTRMINDERLFDKKKSWLKQVPRTCLNSVMNDLGEAWQGFFDGLKGERANRPGKPQLKVYSSASEGVSFQIDPRHKQQVDVEKKTIRLAKLGHVPAVFTETIPGKLTSVTVREIFQPGVPFRMRSLPIKRNTNVSMPTSKTIACWK